MPRAYRHNPDHPSTFAVRGGRAPEEFQCTHVDKHTLIRCKKWRMRGVTKCRTHQRRGRASLDNPSPQKVVRHKGKMGRFYGKVLTGTLREFVESCCNLEPHEQLALWEELALVRHSSLQSIAMYNLCCTALPEETQEQKEKKLERVMQAADMMRVSIDQVARLSEKQANIVYQAKDKVTIHNIDYAVRQVVALMWDCFGDLGPEVLARMQLLEARVRAEVKIAGTAEGTTLTPDMDAREMDSTVPRDESGDDVVAEDVSHITEDEESNDVD